MATTADFKNGLCIEFNGDLWKIVEFQHVKPGKGPAFVTTLTIVFFVVSVATINTVV